MHPLTGLPTPSPHALALAGVHFTDARPPVVEAIAAAEIAVVISRSRDPYREVHVDRCRREGVPIVQRPSGGGAVVLAPGVVVASALHQATGRDLFPEPHFARFCGAVAAALLHCGVADVVRRGVSDLCIGDRKIAGTSLRLWRSRVLFQVSVLVDVELALIERYLAVPSRAPAYRAGRSHGDFLLTLRGAGLPASREAVAEALRRELS